MKTLQEKRIARVEKLSGKKVVWGNWSYWSNVPYLDLSDDFTDAIPLAEDIGHGNSHAIFEIGDVARDAEERRILKRLFWKAKHIGLGNCPGKCWKCECVECPGKK